MIIKFYGAFWLYFGITIALLAAGIPTRDVRNSTHDILFANNVSPKKLIISRTLSMVLSFSILIWGLFFIIRGIQSGADFDLDFQIQARVFTVLWIHYMGAGILLLGIAMIPIVSKGKNLAILVLVFFILMATIPFLNPNLEFLKYFSYFTYYDSTGLLLEKIKFSTSISISLLMLLGSIIFTYCMMRFKFSKTDLR